MKSSIIWDIMPCSSLKVYRRFGAINQHEAGRKKIFACCLLDAGFLLGLPFNLEAGGDTSFRNVGWPSTKYTVLHPRHCSYTLQLIYTYTYGQMKLLCDVLTFSLYFPVT
jgi:hypothetical protein